MRRNENIQVSLFNLSIIWACFVSSFLHTHIASAQSDPFIPDSIAEKALEIAKRIENDQLIITPLETIQDLDIENLNQTEKLIALRFATMDSAVSRINLPLDEILKKYKKEAVEQNSSRDIAIAEIIDLGRNLEKLDLNEEPGKSHLKSLLEYKSNPDWFVAQRAVLVESALPAYTGNYDISLKETQSVLTLIPNEISNDVAEAQFETYDHISFLQFVLTNVELGVSTAEQVIEKGIAHNREIDGIGLINNMVYAFNSWHEYETAEKLAAILFRLSKQTDTNISSFAYYRYGQAQNNAGHYNLALENLNTALSNTQDPKLRLGIESARAIALAGMGRAEEATKSFDAYDELSKAAGITTKNYQQSRLRARALIAMNSGNAVETEKLQEERIKNTVQSFLSERRKGIQRLQANLENSKDRQAERETALLRETQLKQSELEAKQRSNVFLMALAALLLLIAAAAIGFAVWRQKISKILEIAAHDAKAGDRAKSQFLSVMSHELRTPLNGIIGIAGILSEKGETKELRNYNKLILKSGQNLLELLSGILDMAQMESGKLSIVTAPASIRQIIAGLYEAAKKDVDESKVQFTCFVSDNIPDDLMLDSIRVKQSLSNLLANAVRFTEKGRIHIHTTMSEPDHKGVRELTMIVADTGRGITDEVKEKLFKPFVQADSSLTRTHDGAGIGLAVTRGLSRLMGGDVTMTSTAGRGSEFKMVIKTCVAHEADFDPQTNRPVFEIEPSISTKIDFSPAVSIEKLRADAEIKEKEKIKQDLYGASNTAQAESLKTLPETAGFNDENDGDFETIAGAQQLVSTIHQDDTNPRAGFSRTQPRSDSASIEPDQLSGLNILVVEDIEANLEILCSLLEPVGCSVSCAENGQIALDMMKTQTFDAVLMDIRMPILDGIEATKAIRNLPEPHCSTAIIALTADASAENNAECLAAGADVFLTKPVIVSELFSSIRFARRKQLRQKQNSQQALSA